MNPVPIEPEFDLFISYVRRDALRTVAGRTVDIIAELKRELEKHSRREAMPRRRRRFRVCTDLDDFALDGTFDEIMRRRISHSRGFLLVCSPSVSDSRYVRQELEIFKQIQHRLPLAALLGATVSEAAPDVFAADQIAADLEPIEGTTMRNLRALLRRESHKIVARVWGLTPQQVYDRFEADRRSVRHKILSAVAMFVFFTIVLIVALAGEFGFHRVAILPIADTFVAPAGIGFAEDGQTPVVIDSDKAWIWSKGIGQTPQRVQLPFPVLHAIEVKPGIFFVAGLSDIAELSIPEMSVRVRSAVQHHVEGIAATHDTMFVSDEDGALLVVDAQGRSISAPRPISVTGRRFKAFREKGPFQFGSMLAVDGRQFLATATLTGHVALFDFLRNSFVVAPEPQFPLAEPIEQRDDPVLYESENTRPIGSLTFLPDSSLLFSEGNGLRRVDTTTGHITPLTHCPIELIRQIIPFNGGRSVIALTSSTMEVLHFSASDPNHLDCKQRAGLAPNFAPQAAMASDGKTVLLAFFDGHPELWQRTFRLFGLDLPLLH